MKSNRRLMAVWSLCIVCGSLPLFAAVVTIKLPLETAVFKTAPGFEMANAQCLTCHSVEYVQMQPPKPLEFWSAEIKKMRDKYGAPIPKEYDAEIAYYLAKNYGVTTNDSAAIAPVANSVPASTDATSLGVEAYATKYGCLSCHKVDAKVVGPAFRDVAAKYQNDTAALDKIKQQIHNGGSGKWGSAVMPPYNTIVTDAQADLLGRWILSQNAAKQ